jgi:uncharacterized delta-60 repeat protein
VFVERLSAAGQPDPSFGSGGQVTGPAGVARAVAIQSDGKIVLAGASGGGMFAERLNADGTPDGSFGSGGIAHALVGSVGAANAVAIQPNGKIVLAGSINPSVTQLALARFNANGSLDASFGSGGTVELGAEYSVAEGLAVRSDGTIVFAGRQQPSGHGITDSLAGRLSSSGATEGVFQYFHPAGGGYSSLNAVAIQNDGKIVLGGVDLEAGADTADSGPHALFVRLNADGTADTSFGPAGLNGGGAAALGSAEGSSTGDPIGADGVGIAGGGRIVAAGSFEDTGTAVYPAMWAVTPSGSPETTFAESGTSPSTTFDYGSTVIGPTISYEACALAVAPDGSLVAVGDTVASYPDVAPCVAGGSSKGFVEQRIGYGPPPPPPPASIPPVTPSSQPPLVSTGGAKSITEVSAIVEGQINAEGEGTSYQVQWGTTKVYKSSTTVMSAGSAAAPAQVSTTLKRLRPHTTYHYRIVATSAAGTADGADRTFTTNRRLTFRLTGLARFYRDSKIATAGLALRIRCSQPCNVRGSLLALAATAQRLRLGRHQVVLGSGSLRLRRSGKGSLRLRLSHKAKGAIGRVAQIVLRLRIVSTPSGGGPSVTLTKTVTLKR